MITFSFYLEPMDSQECVDQTVENLSASYDLTERTPQSRWSEIAGAGYRGDVSIEGTEFEFVSFCSTDHEVPFEILLISDQATADRTRPGFDLIRDSFERHTR